MLDLAPVTLAKRVLDHARKERPFEIPEGQLGDDVVERLIEGFEQLIAEQEGFIYLASNAAWPGLYKVGCTRKSVDARMRSLAGAGVATAWHCHLAWPVYDTYGLEALAHKACRGYHAQKEFFYGPAEALAEQISFAIVQDLASLRRWLGPHWLPEDFYDRFDLGFGPKNSNNVDFSAELEGFEAIHVQSPSWLSDVKLLSELYPLTTGRAHNDALLSLVKP